MIGWLFWLELARERRVRRERAWRERERELEAQAERQRARAPEPGVEEEEPISFSGTKSPAFTPTHTFGISDGWWAIGLAILLSPIGYVFGATAYVIVGLVVAVAIMIVAFNVR